MYHNYFGEPYLIPYDKSCYRGYRNPTYIRYGYYQTQFKEKQEEDLEDFVLFVEQ
jgi:hypothetical protein